MKYLGTISIFTALWLVALPALAAITIVNESETSVSNSVNTTADSGGSGQADASVDIKTVVNGETVTDIHESSQSTSSAQVFVSSTVRAVGATVIASSTVKVQPTVEKTNGATSTMDNAVITPSSGSGTTTTETSVAETTASKEPTNGFAAVLDRVVSSIKQFFHNLFSIFS